MNVKVLTTVVLGLVLAGIAAGQEEESKADEYPKFLTYGDIRLRQTYGWKWDLGDGHQNFGRYRARIGEKIQVSDDVTFDARFSWEFRAYRDPEPLRSVDFGEAFFDSLNVNIDNLFDTAASVKIGRQDIFLNRWLIFSGTAADGARSSFFDAVRLNFDLDQSDTRVDLLYINNRGDSSDRLKPLGDKEVYLTHQDEHGAVVYLTNKSLENTTAEGYFIYRNDNPIDGVAAPWTKKAEIFTLGGALDGSLDENWKYRVEAAVQSGGKDTDNDGSKSGLLAYGTNNNIAYHFKDKHKSNLRLEYEFLSGDDDSTSKDEGFEPLWGQYTRFSEMYVYTYMLEGTFGEFTNLHRTGLFFAFDPVAKITSDTGYQLLWAAQDKNGDARFSGNGDVFRGQLLTSRLSYRLSKDATVRLDAEYFIPGNYYADDYRQDATLLRAELLYTF